MREIKFRAWNSYQKKMHDWPSLGEADKHNHLSLWNLLIGEVENIIPLQFTGLKGKNGKEIYEGDIVEYADDWISEVTFSQGCFCVWTRYLADYSEDGVTDMVVIGNIYENPELIGNSNNQTQ